MHIQSAFNENVVDLCAFGCKYYEPENRHWKIWFCYQVKAYNVVYSFKYDGKMLKNVEREEHQSIPKVNTFNTFSRIFNLFPSDPIMKRKQQRAASFKSFSAHAIFRSRCVWGGWGWRSKRGHCQHLWRSLLLIWVLCMHWNLCE